MCGLVGLAGDCTANMKDIFSELLLVDVVRGQHSTGAALVKRMESEILMEKAPMPSPDFVRTKEYEDLINNVGVKVMLGHNRYATIGEKTAANSHPFHCGNIVGAHNGTLDAWIVKQLEGSFGTDSETLYNSIAKFGLKNTIAKLSGAWALTWFDRDTDTINMLRNHKRPLYYAYSEDRTTLFWGSEEGMLDWVLSRHNVKLFDKSIYSCDVDKHYKWFIPDKFGGKFDKPTLQEVKERVFSNHARHFSWKNDSGWDHNSDNYGLDYGNAAYGHNYGIGGGYKPDTSRPLVLNPTPVSQAAKAVEEAKKIDTKKFRPPYKDALGKVLTKIQFEEVVATGCVFCDTVKSQWGDFILPLKDDVMGKKIYLCEECYNDDDTRELIKYAL